MNNKIELPGTAAQLCFIKKLTGVKQKYSFMRANIEHAASDVLRSWLQADFKELNENLLTQQLKPYDPVKNGQNIILNLEEIKDRWDEFTSRAFGLDYQSKNFDEISHFKDGYIIYVQSNDGKIYGRINKITTSHILHAPKAFFLAKTFDKLVPMEGIKLDEEPDILFYPSTQDVNKTEFIVLNKKNFELLFDYDEYKKKAAKGFLTKISNVFPVDIDFNDDTTLDSLWDKNIINMLNKPMIKDIKQYNPNIEYLERVKQEYPALQFEIDKVNNKLIFPSKDLKKNKPAFMDALKAISYHYATSFDDKLLEVYPIRIIKALTGKTPKKTGLPKPPTPPETGPKKQRKRVK